HVRCEIPVPIHTYWLALLGVCEFLNSARCPHHRPRWVAKERAGQFWKGNTSRDGVFWDDPDGAMMQPKRSDPGPYSQMRRKPTASTTPARSSGSTAMLICARTGSC